MNRPKSISLLAALFALAFVCLINGVAFASAAADLKTGQSLFAAGDYDGAVAAVKEIVGTKDPLAPDALILIGDCYRAKKDWDKAISSYQSARIDYPCAVLMDKEIRRRMMGCYCYKEDYASIEREVSSLESNFPVNAAWWYFNLGRHYYWIGAFDRSVDNLEKAVRLCQDPKSDPDVKDLRLRLGLSYIAAKRWESAQAWIVGFAREYPSDTAMPHYLQGMIFQIQGQYQEAKSELMLAIQQYKDSKSEYGKDMRRRLMACYTGIGEDGWADTISIAEEMAIDHPEDTSIWGPPLIHAYLDTQQYEKAIPICKNMLVRSPETAVDALTVLAECMYPLGKGQEALTYQEQYFQQHPDKTLDADWARARTLYYAQRDFPKAADALKRFADNYPNSPLADEAKLRLGTITLWQLHKPAEAQTILRELPLSKSKANEIRYSLAYCSYCQDNFAEAKEQFQLLYSSCQEANYRASALYMVGDCYVRLGDKSTAKKTFETLQNEYPNEHVTADAARRLAQLQ